MTLATSLLFARTATRNWNFHSFQSASLPSKFFMRRKCRSSILLRLFGGSTGTVAGFTGMPWMTCCTAVDTAAAMPCWNASIVWASMATGRKG